jgi:hypothetical protein
VTQVRLNPTLAGLVGKKRRRTRDDGANPVLLREQARAAASSLFLLPILLAPAGAAAAVVRLWLRHIASGGDLGGEAVRDALNWVVGPIAVAWIGFEAFSGVRADANPTRADALALTTLDPGVVLRGHVGLAWRRVGLVLSAATPAVAASYHLRGVSLEEMGLRLAHTGAVALTATWILAHLGAYGTGFSARSASIAAAGVAALFVVATPDAIGFVFMDWFPCSCCAPPILAYLAMMTWLSLPAGGRAALARPKRRFDKEYMATKAEASARL